MSDAETRLALSYSAPAARDALRALFALDDMLATVVRGTREPLIGQMRLTWWYHALVALDDAPPPGEPVLQALHATVLPRGVTGHSLAAMTDGWGVLIGDEPLDAAALATFAEARGAALFGAAATLLGVRDPRVAAAGRGWALADLAGHVSDRAVAALARASATEHLGLALRGRWPRPARPLGALALLARFDMADVPPPAAGPRRVARLAWHGISGL